MTLRSRGLIPCECALTLEPPMRARVERASSLPPESSFPEAAVRRVRIPDIPRGVFPMSRSLLTLLWIPLCAHVAAARTEVADPRFSQISPVVVGSASGLPEAMANGPELSGQQGFVVLVRDVNNAPVYGRAVVLNFAGTGVRLYAEQDSGCVADCVAQTLTASSDRGSIVLHPRFGGSVNLAMVEVTAGGVILGTVPARSTDMDAQGGSTGLGDFTLFAPLFLAATTSHPEADFDASGGPIGLADFTIFAREYESGAHGSYCP